MKVKCVGKHDGQRITIGKEYEVIDSGEKCFLITNDVGNQQNYLREHFKVTEPDNNVVENPVVNKPVVNEPIKPINNQENKQMANGKLIAVKNNDLKNPAAFLFADTMEELGEKILQQPNNNGVKFSIYNIAFNRDVAVEFKPVLKYN